MHTQKRIYGQTAIGLDQCFSFLDSNQIVGFKIQCVGHKRIFNGIGYNRKQQRDSHWTFCENFICYIYMYICVHCCKLYCLPYNRLKKKKNYLKIPRLPDIKETQRFSSSTQWKEEEMSESHERNFHATVVTGMEVFDLASTEGEFCLILYSFGRAFK